MDVFSQALISQERSSLIPEEFDFWGLMIGEWDLLWCGRIGAYQDRQFKGEWIFSRILNGTAIQDVFIVPSREENTKDPQQDAEYGTTIRIYNPEAKNWNVFYGATREATRLTAQKEGNQIVLTELSKGDMKWVFSDIKPDSFHWRNIRSFDGGSTFITTIDIYATRRR